MTRAQFTAQDWSKSEHPLVQELYNLGWALAIKVERGDLLAYAWRNTPHRKDITPEFVGAIDSPGAALDRILIAVLESAKSADRSDNLRRSMSYTEVPLHSCCACRHMVTAPCPPDEKGMEEYSCHHPAAGKPFPVLPVGRCPHHETKSSTSDHHE
jgi:hypothetical protein